MSWVGALSVCVCVCVCVCVVVVVIVGSLVFIVHCLSSLCGIYHELLVV